MKQNLNDILGHMTAILDIYQSMNDKICEDTENARWISFIILEQLKEIREDLQLIADSPNAWQFMVINSIIIKNSPMANEKGKR